MTTLDGLSDAVWRARRVALREVLATAQHQWLGRTVEITRDDGILGHRPRVVVVEDLEVKWGGPEGDRPDLVLTVRLPIGDTTKVGAHRCRVVGAKSEEEAKAKRAERVLVWQVYCSCAKMPDDQHILEPVNHESGCGLSPALWGVVKRPKAAVPGE